MNTILPGMVLCFTGNRNHKNKSDFTTVFLPECRAFMKLYNIPKENHLMVDLDLTEVKRKKSVFDFIKKRAAEEGKAPNTLVFLCHGLKYKIELGIRRYNCDELSALLRKLHGPTETKMTVIYYCCSTAGGPGENGDNGFSDKTRDSLCKYGFIDCRVLGHSSAGHATKNPLVRLFEGLGSPAGGVGGAWIVAPKTPLFPKWRNKLANTDLRFRIGFMSVAEVHNELIA